MVVTVRHAICLTGRANAHVTDCAPTESIAAKVCPADVRVSIEPSAGGLSPEDWILVQQVVQAVKAALPDAAERNPTEVFQFVLGALRQADAKTINGE